VYMGRSRPPASAPAVAIAASRVRLARRDFIVTVPFSQAESKQGPAARVRRETAEQGVAASGA